MQLSSVVRPWGLNLNHWAARSLPRIGTKRLFTWFWDDLCSRESLVLEWISYRIHMAQPMGLFTPSTIHMHHLPQTTQFAIFTSKKVHFHFTWYQYEISELLDWKPEWIHSRVTCNEILIWYQVNRYKEWTCSRMYVIPVSCKQPPIYCQNQ